MGLYISTKVGMYVKPITVCSNDYPGFTLTCFTARSNFATSALGRISFARKSYRDNV